jgi:hypothetical protein
MRPARSHEHIILRCREMADDGAGMRISAAMQRGSADGTIDFVEAIAIVLPLGVILKLLGAPEDDGTGCTGGQTPSSAAATPNMAK